MKDKGAEMKAEFENILQYQKEELRSGYKLYNFMQNELIAKIKNEATQKQMKSELNAILDSMNKLYLESLKEIREQMN